MKFKVGDRVEVTPGDNRYGRVGKVGVIDRIDLYPNDLEGDLARIVFDGRDNHVLMYTTKIKHFEEKTMENLQPGDILLNTNDTECEVFAVLGKVVIINDGDDDQYTATYIIEELINEGWQVKGTEPEVKEVTLEEIAEKMNIPVSQLRIKD